MKGIVINTTTTLEETRGASLPSTLCPINGGTAVVGLLHNTEDSDIIDPCQIDDGRRKFQNWKNGK